ncbi:MAG: SBBP repeat-containing protein, partial [Flavobacteriales bacterium]
METFTLQGFLRNTILFCLSLFVSNYTLAQTNWLRKAGGNNLDEALDIARVATTNDYYVTGHFSGVANFNIGNLASSGSSDVFLSKYDQNGIPLWAKRFGGSGTDRSAAVVADNSGQAFIAGFFSGTATFGTTTLTAADSSDVFVAKVNQNGDVIWAKQAGGIGNDGATGVAIDGSGNVYITGQFRGTATFGSTTLTSMDYDGGNNPSADIFTAKLDTGGNWIWVKQGSAGSDERPSDICTDGSNNVYICGQFSGDIEFDQVHTNTVENAGYLLKYNSSGDEQWFSRITATLVFPQAIRCDSQGNVLVTGESIGQIIFFGTNTEIVSTTTAQSIFLAKYSSTGAVTWGREDGSDSYASSKGIAIGSSNEAYITGLFECVFTEYSDELGPGLFNSAGFRDVFITRYNSDGTRVWNRQYGGPRNEFCSGIAVGSSADQPRIAGSFEKFFHAPGSAPGFQINTTNYTPEELADPNSSASLCGIGNYGSMIHLEAQGNKDIFIGYLVDLDLPHYDYYSRETCTNDIVEPCIGDAEVPLNCTDSITICGNSALYINWNTGSNCWIGPEYEWEWGNGSTAESIMAEETGWYTIESETADGCRSQVDSIWVEILEIPIPVISDDELINIESPPEALDIVLCAPDEVVLTA